MAATYDLTTDIGKVRLLINDTDVSNAHFTDEEITAFLDINSSINIAAALALESWAASLTESAEKESIGDYSYSKKSASNKLMLAKQLRENEANEPNFDTAAFDFTDVDDSEDIE